MCIAAQGGAEWEVAPNLELGDDYVMLPKSLWDVMVDWYGGGPVFCRQVVKVATSSLELPKRARRASDDEEPASSSGRYAVCRIESRFSKEREVGLRVTVRRYPINSRGHGPMGMVEAQWAW